MNSETIKLFDLSGRVAIVTGAARGLGAAIARGLAGAGASVVVTDIQEPVQPLADGLHFLRADISKQAEVEVLVQSTVERLGRLDVMVSNAGIPGGSRAEEETEQGLDSVLAVNVKGTFAPVRPSATCGS